MAFYSKAKKKVSLEMNEKVFCYDGHNMVITVDTKYFYLHVSFNNGNNYRARKAWKGKVS